MTPSGHPLAVHFGAGNIGRGLLAPLYSASGYQTTLIDVDTEIIDALNERGAYDLHVVSDEGRSVQRVEHVHGLSALDGESAQAYIAAAEIVSTAVGAAIFPSIAPTLAAGIEERFAREQAAPLDILVCENLHGAPDVLRKLVFQHLDAAALAWASEHVGFVETVVGRMVPGGRVTADDPLSIAVEPYGVLPVDSEGFRGPIPAITGLEPMAPFSAMGRRKLYIHNAGHAAAAYLGYLRGYEILADAMKDAAVRLYTEGAMVESAEAIEKADGVDRTVLKTSVSELVHRFSNRALGDTARRVGKDPSRKLQGDDRLIGAGLFALAQGIEPHALGLATAAAIRYDPADDPGAQHVQGIFRSEGVAGVLDRVSGLDASSPLIPYVTRGHERLLDEGWVS